MPFSSRNFRYSSILAGRLLASDGVPRDTQILDEKLWRATGTEEK